MFFIKVSVIGRGDVITAADPAQNLTDFRVLKFSAGGMGVL